MPYTPDLFDDVAQFHKVVLLVQPGYAKEQPEEDYAFERFKFMHEELSEFVQADNLVDKADALADLIYVALGTAYGLGLPFNAIWEAVHEANMQKVSGQTKRGNKVDAMKPPGWTGPEIRIKAIIDASQ